MFGFEYLNFPSSGGKKREKEEKKKTESLSQSILWKLIWKYLEGSIEKYPAMSID